MKKYNKLTALAILVSILSMHVAMTQVAFAQSSGIIQPSTDKDQYNYNNINELPKINITPYQEEEMTPSPQTLRGQITTIPAGTVLPATVNSTIGSNVNQIGDIFTAKITSPLTIDNNLVIPEGSEAIGQVTYIDPAGRAGKDGSVDVRFTSVKLLSGQRIPLTGKIMTLDKTGSLKGGSLKKQIVTGAAKATVATAGGALTGLTIGGLAGVPARMTVFGTAVGGFLGLGYVIANKGKEAILPAGTMININIEQPVSVGK